MKREIITARVHPEVLEEMKGIRENFKHEGWGGVIEEMAKQLWPMKFCRFIPGKYERDTKETEVNWKGSKP